jgi:hypothetical protein
MGSSKRSAKVCVFFELVGNFLKNIYFFSFGRFGDLFGRHFVRFSAGIVSHLPENEFGRSFEEYRRVMGRR